MEIEQLLKFEQLVANHDLTFEYSDSGSTWSRGSAQLSAIKKASRELTREVVVRIWNNNVDKKIIDGHREQWYWSL